MGIEVRPLGVSCNIRCEYCYQNPERDADNELRSFDLGRIIQTLEKTGRDFILFGGEPLMMPVRDLERLWALGLERFGKNGIQTNGTLIKEEHVTLFKEYKVQVGISLDGPDELNDVRWSGSLDRTREATAKSHAATERLCREGLRPSLIVTLHKGNALPEHLPRMHRWFREWDEMGVRAARLHLMEVEHRSVRDKWALSDEQNLAAALSLLKLEGELKQLKLDLFKDMRDLLMGQDRHAPCIWHSCDPYTTKAVQGLEGNGQWSNCGRTIKDGINFVKADVEGFERYMALYQTPHEYGGCQGCRFFMMCKGQCPGTGIDGDWRNRTEHCQTWKGLLSELEGRLLDAGEFPLSVSPQRRELETAFVQNWSSGRNATIAAIVERHEKNHAEKEGQAKPRSTASSGAAQRNDQTGSNSASTEESSSAPQPKPLRRAHGMELLTDFTLPGFARLSWVSDAAREVWHPRIARITKVWLELEWRTVQASIRRCGIMNFAPEQYPEEAAQLLDNGLATLPIEVIGTSNSYSNVAERRVEAQPCHYRIVVGALDALLEFKAAWDDYDQRQIGALLGYPDCCQDFFDDVWGHNQLRDTTWPMAKRTVQRQEEGHVIQVSSPWETNILWRWMSVRPVSHLPCAFDCSATIELARRFVELARRQGYEEEMNWLTDILAWPVQWSALHGIAEIKTPILKVSAATDPTTREYVVRRAAASYPPEGAQGLRFPFRLPSERRAEPPSPIFVELETKTSK